MKALIPLFALLAVAFYFRNKWERELSASAESERIQKLLLAAEQLGVDVPQISRNAAKSYAVENFDLVLLLLFGSYLVFGLAFHYTFPKGH